MPKPIPYTLRLSYIGDTRFRLLKDAKGNRVELWSRNHMAEVGEILHHGITPYKPDDDTIHHAVALIDRITRQLEEAHLAAAKEAGQAYGDDWLERQAFARKLFCTEGLTTQAPAGLIAKLIPAKHPRLPCYDPKYTPEPDYFRHTVEPVFPGNPLAAHTTTIDAESIMIRW